MQISNLMWYGSIGLKKSTHTRLLPVSEFPAPLSLPVSLSLSLSHTHTHTHTVSLSLSLSHTHTSLSLSLPLSLSLSLARSLALPSVFTVTDDTDKKAVRAQESAWICFCIVVCSTEDSAAILNSEPSHWFLVCMPFSLALCVREERERVGGGRRTGRVEREGG